MKLIKSNRFQDPQSSYSKLIVVEYLIGIVQDRLNHADLPSSIRNIRASAHEGGS